MEKSCIATNIPGTTEALIDYHNGLLIDVHSYEQLARKIILLAKNPTLRNKLGKNARFTVLSQFDMKILVKQNEEIYLQLRGVESSLSASDLPVPLDNPFITG
jgi:glycosyltransferase involved in cell wall biosynthesis